MLFFIFKYIFRLFSYCCLRSSVKGKRPPSFLPPPLTLAVTVCRVTVRYSGPGDHVRTRKGSLLPEQTSLPSIREYGAVGSLWPLSFATDLIVGRITCLGKHGAWLKHTPKCLWVTWAHSLAPCVVTWLGWPSDTIAPEPRGWPGQSPEGGWVTSFIGCDLPVGPREAHTGPLAPRAPLLPRTSGAPSEPRPTCPWGRPRPGRPLSDHPP